MDGGRSDGEVQTASACVFREKHESGLCRERVTWVSESFRKALSLSVRAQGDALHHTQTIEMEGERGGSGGGTLRAEWFKCCRLVPGESLSAHIQSASS